MSEGLRHGPRVKPICSGRTRPLALSRKGMEGPARPASTIVRRLDGSTVTAPVENAPHPLLFLRQTDLGPVMG